MKKIEGLKAGDFIAFAWSYFNGEPKEIWVSDITSVSDGRFLVHFLYGYKSIGEWIKKEDVLAIGNSKGVSGIKGWSGKFDILKPEDKLIIDNLKSSSVIL